MIRASRLGGEERPQVLADLRHEREQLAEALRGLTGEDLAPEQTGGDAIGALEAVATRVPGEAVLQGSWVDGRIVVWAGGPGAAVVTGGALEGFLAAADASGIDWERHAGVPLPDGGVAEARSAPISQTLGWLVGIGSGQVSGAVAPSLRWLAELAIWGTELVAQGRMVPVLRGTSPGQGSKQASGGGSNKAAGSREKSSDTTPAASKGPSRHRVRWMPALVSRERFVQTVARMPGSVATLQVAPQPDGVCRSVLTAVVDAISRAGADRLVLPAATPRASTRPEISEAVLSGLDGRPFVADAEPAARLADDLKRWANPVLAPTRVVLIVRLDPPAADGGWQLSVEASGVDKSPMPIEHALVVASGSKAQQVEGQLRRLERLLPVLRRPTTRRGQVILDGDEAADLMFNSGPMIAAAGFEVYLPRISRRRPSPKLHLFAEGIGGKAQVGIQQLSNVRWSVFFDDLELDASAIARLVAEAKPLVQVKGRWVHIDRADLMDAAAALAERASITQLSGAALIRHAVGLEGGALGGPVEVGGQGWAVELLKGATTDPPAPLEAPPGFHGQLRHYQAEAAGWLGFLDRAGLGGCLAMDMGLGKTPTVLAHLLAHASEGPSLVVCPPAVLSNWATEAERFTPGLRVAVHHGPRRAQVEDIEHLVSGADVLLTTYTTGARDVDLLSRVDWQNLVIDEAQAIKNHQSDTARTLRQIPARSRLAMTGTPVENGLGDLWSILDFTNPGLVGSRASFIERLSRTGDKSGSTEEGALRALNGLLVFRRTKTEPEIAAELPDKVDKLDHCAMTGEQIGLYQAVIDRLIEGGLDRDANQRKGQVLAAITALKQICDHPAAYLGGDGDSALEGRSGKLTRLEEIVEDVFAAGERILIFTHFARWGERMAVYLSERTGRHVGCYHGGLGRSARDQLIHQFQNGKGAGALVLSIKAGGSGLNLTAASHVVLYDRWWNPAVEDQARDRAWRIGQTNTVMSHRLVCPGTVDERVEEIVAGKRQVAGLVLPARSSLGDLDASQLRVALGLKAEELIEEESSDDARLHSSPAGPDEEEAA